MAEDLTKLIASTLDDWIDGGNLHDVAFVETPYTDLIRKSNMLDMKAGPKKFKFNVRTGKNDNFQYYTMYETWETKPLKGYTQGEWESRQAVMPWSIAGEEIEYNDAGDMGRKLWDILNEVKDNTGMAIREQINVRLINRLDSSIPVEQQDFDFCWNSLVDLIGDESSSPIDIGNISAVDNFWWRSLIKRPGYGLPPDPKKEDGWTRPSDANVISGGAYDGWQYLVLSDVTKMIWKLNRFYRDGYVALTTQEVLIDLIEQIKAEQTTVNTNLTGTLIAGYSGVEWMGVPFTWDPAVPEGTIFFIHPKCLKFRAIPNRWLKATEPITPYNQDALYGKIFAWGQQFCTERRALGAFQQVAVR